MMEISPVLAGTFDRPDYAPASVNFNSGGETSSTSDTTAVDPRRYSQFDRTASQVGDATMSFSDFLDMVNPLQHIPVISSVYRAITGDTINPVARIAGDILYGIPLGPVAALAGGVGGIADSVMVAKTGKDMAGTVMASLFGDDKPGDQAPTTEVANAATTSSAAAAAVTTAPLQPMTAAATPPTPTAAADGAAQGIVLAKAIPLNRNGNTNAPARTYHDENLAMAVSKATGIRIGNTVYANRMANGARALPAAPPTVQAAAAAPTTNMTASATSPELMTALPAENAAPPLPSTPMPAGKPSANSASAANVSAVNDASVTEAFSDDPYILKALGMYQSMAASAAYSSTAMRN